MTYLIVEQQQQPPDNLPELLKQLSGKYGLDIYQSRQRLVGRGLSLLHKGERKALEEISPLLTANNFVHYLVDPRKPEFVPLRLRSLSIENEKIVFTTQKREVVIPKGANLLVLFAEMSGALAEKSVSQLLSSHAYRGRDNVRHIAEHKVFRTILQGKPILDIYLLDADNTVIDAVRIFPGKFDPKGLGERATVSATQNLDRILKLVEEYAGEFTLATDFGLVNLPGCNLRRETPDEPDTQRQNQLSLARYGWLRADILRAGPVLTSAPEKESELRDSIAAAMLTQNPALAAGSQVEEILPIAEQIAKEIERDDPVKEKKPPVTAEEGLPAPPPIRPTCNWSKPSFWFGSAGAAIAIAIVALFELDSSDSFGDLAAKAFQSGFIFLLLSALLVWSGFSFIRLKRQIENTPTSKARSIAMGMVEVKGRAIRQYALISPMSQIPCVFYRLTKFRRENNQWQVTSSSTSDSVPFLLEDDTGKVEIDPAGCRVSAGTKYEGRPGTTGMFDMHHPADSDEKWVEEVVIEGTLLYVLGFASVKRSNEPTMAQKKVEALRELKRNPQAIEQFDADGDGRISEQEWDSARQAVADKVLREELQKKKQRKKQEEHIVIGKKKGRPMVIAETHSEERLTGRYAIYASLMLAAAVGLAAWGINNLLNFFT
ncbi:E3 Ubiquitin ligase [Malonomonas rubra DSM 5091]|uniref:RING-type E3 ubiquitin transferase n=1 Tax=Malonomonas rubra DSM 5091 TaxID=1122189 RepID=A0A1M6JFI3_MALRU|nr:GIDE domain-containing protein [Malonomonas rubra]SHJ45461.1 E3 Ubiquitin ligase [Malonomonas rubra DSM 5091]